MTRSAISRREFMQATTLGATLAFTGRDGQAAAQAPSRWKVIAFSKPFTNLSFDDTAALVAEVGWDGIECPVRKASSHIAPEKVDDDLPRMVEALRKRKLEVAMITTDIVGVDATAEKILRAAVKSGVRNYRLGAIHYTPDRPIRAQIEDIKARLRDLAQLNKTLGVIGGIENHSGQDYFGAPVWDAMQAIEALDPSALGIAFDIGHATIEGGLAWPLHARLAEPRYTVVYVKDYRWEKQAAGWRAAWCPLGEGMLNRKFFSTLAKSSYRGPLCQHHEYDLGKTPAEMLAYFKQDLQTFRQWLRDAA
jgi:sugar phosphate isomerase/epimerase